MFMKLVMMLCLCLAASCGKKSFPVKEVTLKGYNDEKIRLVVSEFIRHSGGTFKPDGAKLQLEISFYRNGTPLNELSYESPDEVHAHLIELGETPIHFPEAVEECKTTLQGQGVEKAMCIESTTILRTAIENFTDQIQKSQTHQ